MASIGFFPPDTNSNAVQTMPTPSAAGAPGYFAQSGTSITDVSADFLNGLVSEFQNLSTAGGIDLTKTSPTMVQNIQALINAGPFVKKVGDTMSGPLDIQVSNGTTNTPVLSLLNNNTGLYIVPSAPANAQNTTTQAGDTLLWYTTGSVNTGALVLAPYGNGSTGGLRIDNTGQVVLNRPATFTNGFSVPNGVASFTNSPSVPTPSTSDSSTNAVNSKWVSQSYATIANLTSETTSRANADSALTLSISGEITRAQNAEALLAPLASPALTGTPTVPSPVAGDNSTKISNTAWVSSYFQPKLGYTPVQQGTGTNQLSNVVKLGWSGSALRATIDGTDMGNIWTDSLVTTSLGISGYFKLTKWHYNSNW